MGNEPSIDKNPKQKSISIEIDAEPVPSSYTIRKNSNPSIVPNKPDSQQQQQQTLQTPKTPDHLSSRLSSKLNTPPIIIPESVSTHTPDSTLSSFPPTPIESKSCSQICNGITGTHIHSKIVKIAVDFWDKYISNMQSDKKLETACAIFFGLSESKQMKEIINTHIKRNNKIIADMSIQFINMIGWLIKHLNKDDIDLYSMLSKLGIFHQKMGVKINHFASMLEAMHETFSYYYPKTYTIEVKYAMDEIFSISAQIMSGEELKYCPVLNDISKTFESENNIQFITDLDACLKSKTGKEYLYQYLQQHFCDELVIFLQLLNKFKSQTTATEMYIVAKDIIRTSVHPNATLTLNVSYDCRNEILAAMQLFDKQFITKEPLNIDSDFFAEIEHEMYRLILQNHWRLFVENIKMLHSKSFGV